MGEGERERNKLFLKIGSCNCESLESPKCARWVSRLEMREEWNFKSKGSVLAEFLLP